MVLMEVLLALPKLARLDCLFRSSVTLHRMFTPLLLSCVPGKQQSRIDVLRKRESPDETVGPKFKNSSSHTILYCFLRRSSLYQYEFGFMPGSVDDTKSGHSKDKLFLEFLADFAECLEQRGFIETLGLSLAPEPDPDDPGVTEFSAGRANVLMPINAAAVKSAEVEAAWMFPCTWNPLHDGAGEPQKRYCYQKCRVCLAGGTPFLSPSGEAFLRVMKTSFVVKLSATGTL